MSRRGRANQLALFVSGPVKVTCARKHGLPAAIVSDRSSVPMHVVSAIAATIGSHIERVMAQALSFGLLGMVAIALFSPSTALAHAQLDRAASAADSGRFEEAVMLLTSLIEGERLSREDLVQALERRVLVYYALRRHRPLRRDLDFLLAMEPAMDFGSSAPPDLAATIEERRRVSQQLEVSAHVEDLHGEVRVVARGHFVVEGFALHTLVGARSPDGEFRLSHDAEVRYRPPPGGGRVEYFAAVIGPGGAVLVGDGSQTAPKVHQLPPPRVVEAVKPPVTIPFNESHAKGSSSGPLAQGSTTETMPLLSDTGSHGRRRRGLWWTLGSASAVAVVATIVVFVARGTAASSAEVQEPSVEYP